MLQLHVSPFPDLHPKISQCECFSTADKNACAQPDFDKYATHLEAALNVIVPCAVKGTNQPNRGLISLELGRSQPVRTVMSGPSRSHAHNTAIRFGFQRFGGYCKDVGI